MEKSAIISWAWQDCSNFALGPGCPSAAGNLKRDWMWGPLSVPFGWHIPGWLSHCQGPDFSRGQALIFKGSRRSSNWIQEFTPNTSQGPEDLEHIQGWGAPISWGSELCHLTPLILRSLFTLRNSVFLPYALIWHSSTPRSQNPWPPLIQLRKLRLCFLDLWLGSSRKKFKERGKSEGITSVTTSADTLFGMNFLFGALLHTLHVTLKHSWGRFFYGPHFTCGAPCLEVTLPGN